MGASKVAFGTMRVKHEDSVPKKLVRVMREGGLDDLDLKDKIVAIKTHFGEFGNVSFLKPLYVRIIAEEVIARGGKPFVTDCNTLYPGLRSNAVDHLKCAEMNGFNSVSCGCPVIIGDGLRGADYVDVPIDGELVKMAHLGRVIYDADVLISLTHAKGCTFASYGGVLKNLAMGCASRAGKMDQHSGGALDVIEAVCIGCGKCARNCGQNAIEIVDGKAHIDDSRCVKCGHCIGLCPMTAIMGFGATSEQLEMRIGEYAAAVTNTVEQCFHVALAIDITPQCDCFPDNDAPMVPNVGMFAGFDPVALDCAITTKIGEQVAIEDSVLPERHAAYGSETDHLHAINPLSDYTLSFRQAAKLGAGSLDYELVNVE